MGSHDNIVESEMEQSEYESGKSDQEIGAVPD